MALKSGNGSSSSSKGSTQFGVLLGWLQTDALGKLFLALMCVAAAAGGYFSCWSFVAAWLCELYGPL